MKTVSNYTYLPIKNYKNLVTFFKFCFYVFIVYEELESTGKFERMSMKVDEDEHSIEMQLPYIAKVMQE